MQRRDGVGKQETASRAIVSRMRVPTCTRRAVHTLVRANMVMRSLANVFSRGFLEIPRPPFFSQLRKQPRSFTVQPHPQRLTVSAAFLS